MWADASLAVLNAHCFWQLAAHLQEALCMLSLASDQMGSSAKNDLAWMQPIP